jgi:hypothetical protein
VEAGAGPRQNLLDCSKGLNPIFEERVQSPTGHGVFIFIPTTVANLPINRIQLIICLGPRKVTIGSLNGTFGVLDSAKEQA